MKAYACTYDQAIGDISSHEMNILRDDGIYRHIRFKNPTQGAFWFYLITWPGSLCIDGDMGTHVFRRLNDMFEFFRTDSIKSNSQTLKINPGYWGEKLQAIGTYGGYKEFSAEFVIEAVKQHFNNWVESYEPTAEERDDLWKAIEDDVLFYSDDDHHEFMRAIHTFEHGDFHFEDFWDNRTEDFTHHFIWCCFAIAWGIQKYDEYKTKVSE